MANKLMSWDDYQAHVKAMIYSDHVLTEVACPCCGTALYRDESVVLATFPVQYRYFCEVCGWQDYGR